ncbi:MAG: hypothetical protein HC900_11470 [Methylacidiphilales bacterium]|nr:hypothetical protein [Candidatus Methylacidiphilales bacterium]
MLRQSRPPRPDAEAEQKDFLDDGRICLGNNAAEHALPLFGDPLDKKLAMEAGDEFAAFDVGGTPLGIFATAKAATNAVSFGGSPSASCPPLVTCDDNSGRLFLLLR